MSGRSVRSVRSVRSSYDLNNRDAQSDTQSVAHSIASSKKSKRNVLESRNEGTMLTEADHARKVRKTERNQKAGRQANANVCLFFL